MILRSIRAEGWRCFADAVEVGPFGDGLNVVHGPNGSGKSTLLWALARGLFDSHGVTGNDIESLRPWGRRLSPRVTIEFEHDGAAYRLEKQFLDNPKSQLARREDGRYVPLAEATHADDYVRKLLAAEPPGRGASDDRHWGFAQVLWATQGALRIERLSDGTRNSIHDSLGAQLAGPGGEEIERRVAKRYGEIFTPTGRLRGGASAPPLVKMQEELAERQQRRSELAGKLARFDEASRRIEDLQSVREQSEQEAVGLERELEQALEVARKFNELKAECETLAEREKSARITYEQLEQRVERIEGLRRREKSSGEELARLKEKSAAVEEQYKLCQKEAEAAKNALGEVRQRRAKIEQQERAARQAATFLDARSKMGKLTEKIEAIQTEMQQRDDLRKEQTDFLAPSDKSLKEIQQTVRLRDDARLQLDAALIHVQVDAERPLDIQVTQAEEVGKHDLAAGETLQVRGDPHVTFELPGIARIRAAGPTESAEDLRRRWQEAANKLEELTSGYGTQDPGELEALAARRRTLEGKLREAEIRLQTLLEGSDLSSLQNEQKRCEALLKEHLESHPQWNQQSPDADTLSAAAQQARDDYERDIGAAEQRADAADEALSDAQKRRADFHSKLTTVRQRLADITEQLQQEENDGLSPTQRQEKLDEFALHWRAEKAKLRQQQAALEKFGDDPNEMVATLRKQRDSLRTRVADADKELIRAETQLQSIIHEAPYSALAHVEEQIERLQEDIAREELSYQAIRLLHDTFDEQKHEALSAVIEPVQQRANRTLQRIAGGRFEGIEFDESFLPTGVRPAATEEAVVLDYLSGGEQEQTHFAVRLALADVAFGDEQQLVVLDDAFTATDTPRLARIIKILEEAAQRFQILLLSCHPERYRHLENVQFFDLVQLTQASGEETA